MLLVDCNVVVHPSFYRQAFVIKRIYYFAFRSGREACLGGIKNLSCYFGQYLDPLCKLRGWKRGNFHCSLRKRKLRENVVLFQLCGVKGSDSNEIEPICKNNFSFPDMWIMFHGIKPALNWTTLKRDKTAKERSLKLLSMLLHWIGYKLNPNNTYVFLLFFRFLYCFHEPDGNIGKALTIPRTLGFSWCVFCCVW